jgi:hypothetical protein
MEQKNRILNLISNQSDQYGAGPQKAVFRRFIQRALKARVDLEEMNNTIQCLVDSGLIATVPIDECLWKEAGFIRPPRMAGAYVVTAKGKEHLKGNHYDV